jgi:formate dehydrogenase subunit gamma
MERQAKPGVIETAIARHAGRPGGLLPLLHEIQDGLGYVPAEALAPVAAAMRLSKAEVHGVVSFYHHFRQAPPGRHVVRVCVAESCRSMGAQRLVERACKSLGIGLHETSGDGAVTLEPVYCLGNCGCSPAVLIDHDELVGRVDESRLDEILDRCREEP